MAVCNISSSGGGQYEELFTSALSALACSCCTGIAGSGRKKLKIFPKGIKLRLVENVAPSIQLVSANSEKCCIISTPANPRIGTCSPSSASEGSAK